MEEFRAFWSHAGEGRCPTGGDSVDLSVSKSPDDPSQGETPPFGCQSKRVMRRIISSILTPEIQLILLGATVGGRFGKFHH